MSDERYIVPRNWAKYQNADVWKKSGGRPTWIKTYNALLSDDAYLGLSMSQRGILHGLWIAYSASGSKPLRVHRLRHLLSTNKGESRHFLDNLEALNRAGFIDFCRESVATRVEESREEKINFKGESKYQRHARAREGEPPQGPRPTALPSNDDDLSFEPARDAQSDPPLATSNGDNGKLSAETLAELEATEGFGKQLATHVRQARVRR